jgi:hypothetical protein
MLKPGKWQLKKRNSKINYSFNIKKLKKLKNSYEN